MRRAVITGMGMVSPLGHTVSQSWAAALAGKSGIQQYVNDPVIANTKPLAMGFVKGFEQKKWAVPHASSRMNAFAVAASEQAIKMSGIKLEEENRDRVGVSLGVVCSNSSKLSQFLPSSLPNFQSINRLSLLHLITSIPTGILSIRYRTTGPCQTVNTACASGLSAIVHATKMIQYGQADIVLAGGVQDSYNPITVNSCLRIQAMTGKKYDKGEEASRPFDRDRSGFVLGEGCGIVVVEEEGNARKRGANIVAEIFGYGQSSDGYHLVKPQQSGQGQKKAIQKALEFSKTPKQQISFIDCHATSTPTGDEIQASTLLSLFPHRPPLCANKSILGHTLGAAGALQLILAIQSMNSGTLLGIKNLKNPDVQGLDYVTENREIKGKGRKFLKNSFGFGGVNVCAIVGAHGG